MILTDVSVSTDLHQMVLFVFDTGMFMNQIYSYVATISIITTEIARMKTTSYQEIKSMTLLPYLAKGRSVVHVDHLLNLK